MLPSLPDTKDGHGFSVREPRANLGGHGDFVRELFGLFHVLIMHGPLAVVVSVFVTTTAVLVMSQVMITPAHAWMPVI